MSRVVVIGGGPAGMSAAIAAAENGHHVTLLEKNEKLGKKLFITGKGRCNITNSSDMDVLFNSVMTNRKFLYSAFYAYDNQMVIDFFEQAGLPIKNERGNRIFPVSDHSSDVIAALQRVLKKDQVEIRLHSEVDTLLYEDSVELEKIAAALELDKKETKKIIEHLRRIYQNRILCLFQRRSLTVHIPVITVDDILLDLIKITGNTFCSQFIVSSLRSCLRTCGQINLHLRIWKHACSDISSVHDNVRALCKLSLQFH